MSLALSLTRLIRPSNQTVRGRRRIAASMCFLPYFNFLARPLTKQASLYLSLRNRSAHVSPMQNSDARHHAETLDAADPLRALRAKFLIPLHGDHDQLYFCGNSLGLQPLGARTHVEEVLDKWAQQAVEGHFTGQAQWMPYHELVREPLARVVGAEPSEVVAMNSLTANLHLLMVSFYRPTRERPAILMEAGAFPSDRYALESQLRFHGFDPATDLIELEPDEAEGTFSMSAIAAAIERHGPRLALVLWPGVQYRSGQAFDLAEIARLA